MHCCSERSSSHRCSFPHLPLVLGHNLYILTKDMNIDNAKLSHATSWEKNIAKISQAKAGKKMNIANNNDNAKLSQS